MGLDFALLLTTPDKGGIACVDHMVATGHIGLLSTQCVASVNFNVLKV